MPDVFKFPNGYDVTVCRKQDIINCLDENIIDKEVVLAVINQLELDATSFLQSGRWTGIPFLGNIRIPKRIQKLQSKETQELIETARNTLDKDRYLVFRYQLNNDIAYEEKHERFFRYVVSHFVSNNRKYYNKLCKKYNNDSMAQIMCWTLSNLTIGSPSEY